jgi:ABC-type Fe3+/spermidine/putrescine transport system ATPase subunit
MHSNTTPLMMYSNSVLLPLRKTPPSSPLNGVLCIGKQCGLILGAVLRGTAVFSQNYLIFRYMSAADNIEFGMRVHKGSKLERKAMRCEMNYWFWLA